MKGLTCTLIIFVTLLSVIWAQGPTVSSEQPLYKTGNFTEGGVAFQFGYLLSDSVPSKTRILLIPDEEGISASLIAFAEELTDLGKDVYIPDLPGTFDAFKMASRSNAPLSDIPSERAMAFIQSMLERMAYNGGDPKPVVVIGIGEGGHYAFELATRSPLPEATLVFGGEGPMLPSSASRINGPVYGFYASDELQISEKVLEIKRYMLTSEKAFYPIIFPKTYGNFILTNSESPGSGNQAARTRSMERVSEILSRRP